MVLVPYATTLSVNRFVTSLTEGVEERRNEYSKLSPLDSIGCGVSTNELRAFLVTKMENIVTLGGNVIRSPDLFISSLCSSIEIDLISFPEPHFSIRWVRTYSMAVRVLIFFHPA